MQITRIKAASIFFPVACLHAALSVPLAVHAMTGGTGWPPGLLVSGHAHEMLFGFALLLVAGYLLSSASFITLIVLLGLWLAARICYMFAPHSLPAAALSPLFALVLACLVVPKFRSAKKWRNRSVMPLLLALCLLPAAYAAAVSFHWQVTRLELLVAGILLLALLMAFMGGRIIAPAAGGAFYRLGINLRERVQPRLEGAIIILLAIAAITVFLPFSHYGTGITACAGGLVVAMRLFRWRLWQLPGHQDLWCLGLGYGWLALGLVLLGGLMLANVSPIPALHIIAVGALGTLSICVMTRVNLQYLKQDPAEATLVSLSVGLIAIATLARFAAGIIPDSHVELLWTAAGIWSLAYLLTAAQLLFGLKAVRTIKS
ncbi:MAG: NnrS family protein [Gammaproteobacteria bacterium]|jgi:uncharacterized protein involved in response to NO